MYCLSGYMFPEPGAPMFRRPPPPPGVLGLLPPPGPFPPRGLPPGPHHPADMTGGLDILGVVVQRNVMF